MIGAANGIATINALAPGRTFAILGTGNTATWSLNVPAGPLATPIPLG